ncbi:MAG: hypothetical protein LBO09_08810 [Candidatus Peribacteria bacterium]|jgi:hypothetical protein|nr:hypothetical protein [Candidatus Peribacteria bacterium]
MQTQKFFLPSSLDEQELVDKIIPLPAKEEGPAVSAIKIKEVVAIVGKHTLPGFDVELIWENGLYLTTSDVNYYKEWLEAETGEKILLL